MKRRHAGDAGQAGWLGSALVWQELDEIAWAQLRHNYGSAGDVPGLLRRCADRDAERAIDALDELDNLLFHQGG
jgi:hypothetical protein